MALFLTYYAVINVLTAVAFVVDKHKARHGRRRISERTLLGLSLVGGALGGLVGMYTAHHKTRKPRFRYGLPVMFVAHVVLGVCLALAMGKLDAPPHAAYDAAGTADKGAEQSQSADADGVPPLDGPYAYVRVRVVARDLERSVLTVETLGWDGPTDGVNVSGIAPGITGDVDCSELMSMAGTRIGTEWVMAYCDEGQTSFPLKAYAYESADHFAERYAEDNG